MTSHIAQDSAKAASLAADRIERAIKRLAEMPTGRRGRVGGTYERPVPGTSYIAAYAVSDRRITASQVIHGNRNWPDELLPADIE